MFFLVLWGLGLLASGLHFLFFGVPETLAEISSVILLDQFIFTFGSLGIIGIIINVFFAEKTSTMLGWPGGPYQIKYGFSQLGIGLMGVLAIWMRGPFWAATLINMYIYGLSGFWTHTQEMLENGKADASNVGNIIMNFFYQLFITLLSIFAGGIWIFN